MFSASLLIHAAIVVCIAGYASIYLLGIRRGNVRPILATWILFLLATVMSFATNLAESGIQGISANFFNIIDTLSVLLICGFLICHKNVRRSFTVFEKGCVGASILVSMAWIASGQNILAHLVIQIILIIAYIPTLMHLWRTPKNTESFSMWALNCLAAMFGLIEPIRTMSFLSIAYGARAVISTFLVAILILRLQYKQRH